MPRFVIGRIDPNKPEAVFFFKLPPHFGKTLLLFFKRHTPVFFS